MIGPSVPRTECNEIDPSTATEASRVPGARYIGEIMDITVEHVLQSVDGVLVTHLTDEFVDAIDASFDWYQKPLNVRLTVNAQGPVTPSQISDLKRFVQRRTGQPVRIIMFVNRFATVTSGQAPGSDLAPP